MNERRTPSILQRLPVILAVTAAAYGLPLQSQAQQRAERGGDTRNAAPRATAASTVERMPRDAALPD